MKNAKRIGALICVIAICFTLMTAPAVHAAGTPLLGGQQFGALIASGLLSLNIIANTVLQSQPIQSLWEWCSDPTAEDRIDYFFPVLGDTISDYMNASTIKVNQGVTTIDGVEYDELWISPGTFTDGLKTDLFDFKTKWAVLSGQAGTLAQGVGNLSGVPMYRVNNNTRSQTFKLVGLTGNWQFGNDIFVVKNTGQYGRFQNKDNTNYAIFPVNYGETNDLYFYMNNGNPTAFINKPGDQSGYHRVISWVQYDNTPFQFDYVSGIVPAEETDIPEDYGLSLKIPHDKLETFYNTYPEYNVDNTTINIAQDEVDIDQLTQAIFDMIESMDEMKAEWTNGEEPEPPVPVDPIENIDNNVQDISDYQRMLIDYVDEVETILNEQGQNVGFINSALEDLKSQIEQDSEYIQSSAGYLQNILQENGIYYDDFKDLMEDIKQDNQFYHDDMQQQVDHMHQDVEAIHQTQQQQQQVQQQMQQTQQQMQQDTSSIDSTLKDVTATPETSDLPDFKFDLRELFPFCIPFDIYRLLSSFDAIPQAPHVRLPIVIQSIGFSYTLDLDFSAWDPVALAMRTAELIVYAIGLAWATGKVIKW